MLNYEKISLSDVEIGDIIFTELDENNLPISTNLVLRQQPPVGLLIFNLSTSQIDIYDFSNLDIYKLSNISSLLNSYYQHNVEYRWLGFEYGKYKVLVDLDLLTVEKYDYQEDSWDLINDPELCYTSLNSLGQNILNIRLEEKLKFKINLDLLKMTYSNKHSLKEKPFYSFLLGEENDYVFNEENELILTHNNIMEEEENV